MIAFYSYIFNGQINSEHRFFYFSIGAFWLIVSYIIYRYNNSVRISETFRNFISTLLLVTFLNILIFSFINLFNYPHLFKFFNLFFSSSLVIQLGLNIIFLFLYGRKKLWVKITYDNEDNYFVSFKEQLSKNIIIKGISIDSLEKLDFKKFEGIIIDQNLSLKNDQIRLRKKIGQKGLTIITPC